MTKPKIKLTKKQETAFAIHLASTPWLAKIEANFDKPMSLARIKKGLRMWITAGAEIDIDWPAISRTLTEDDLPLVMDRIMLAAREHVAVAMPPELERQIRRNVARHVRTVGKGMATERKLLAVAGLKPQPKKTRSR
ncbi:MAG TPA: hypothetical protein VF331_17920 [Polyangiales bacterium]